jgi:ribosomal protein S18 acetylase RimI-like enzyme
VTIRRATEADKDAIRVLWEEFETEIPPPVGDGETFEEDWVDTSADIRDGAVYLAEDDQGPLGYVRLSAPDHGVIYLNQAHVSPRGRRQGVVKQLIAEALADVAKDGVTHVVLEVLETNATARAVWSRLGFEDTKRSMATPIERLAGRVAAHQSGEHRGSTHVQTDDELSVQRAIAGFIPRLESPQVTSNRSWIRVSDPVLDRDHDAHARFARELAERLGAVTVALSIEGEVVRFRLYERGRMLDEYLSVPSYFGQLSRGDELAMEANPTLVARLTGAEKDDVRRVARTAASPSELPPAADLYEQIANLMGVEP